MERMPDYYKEMITAPSNIHSKYTAYTLVEEEGKYLAKSDYDYVPCKFDK
jgi:hypothetical protein